MAGVYRIFGAELSPYSVKVLSYFRYKGIAHEWIERNQNTQAEYQKYAKLPLVPVVATPEGEGLQDSTPILEAIEAKFPEPSIHPPDPALAFLSALLEEFGDEWGNKWMFHYRWARPVDQESAATRLAQGMMPGLAGEALAKMAAGIRERMVGRVWFVGSSPKTAPIIEASYLETLVLLDEHLATRPYLFGARPAFADFGLWGQLYQCLTDPTPGALMRERAPHVVRWVQRMIDARAGGAFETWSTLAPTLEALLANQVGRLFLPWSDANAKAIASGAETFSVVIGGETWEQKPQKYHARSLATLRQKYAAVADRSALGPILERTGCSGWLT